MDTKGPELSFVDIGVYRLERSHNDGIGGDGGEELVKTSTLYQTIYDDIALSWNTTDADSGVRNVTWMAGSLPFTDDKHIETSLIDDQIPLRAVTMQPGETVMFTVQSTDFAGNHRTLISPALTVDVTAPVIQGFTCSKYLSIVHNQLKCTWAETLDEESLIDHIKIGVGDDQAVDNLIQYSNLTVREKQWSILVSEQIIGTANETVYITLSLENTLGLQSVAIAEVTVNKTPPVGGNVAVTTEEVVSRDMVPVACQRSISTVTVSVTGFTDYESEIER